MSVINHDAISNGNFGKKWKKWSQKKIVALLIVVNDTQVTPYELRRFLFFVVAFYHFFCFLLFCVNYTLNKTRLLQDISSISH